MKVFYSTAYLNNEIYELEPGINMSPGWKNYSNLTQELLEEQFDVYEEHSKEVDLEVYCGQPSFYDGPLMHPAVFISMFERDTVPKSWVEIYNHFDLILNPTQWGVETFRDSGVKNVKYCKPYLDTSVSRERNLTDEFTVLTQIATVGDRKGSRLMRDIYMSEDMPGKLILKTVPNYSGIPFIGRISENIKLIQLYLEDEEYDDFLSKTNLSVNPTKGEGVGLIPAEHILRGIPTLVTNYSGCTEYTEFAIDTFDYDVPHPGALATVNRESVINKIHECYDRRDELEEEAQVKAEEMKAKYEEPFNLRPYFSKLCNTVKKEFMDYKLEEIKQDMIKRIKNPELR